jgi:formylglycine-generating enzyme required for sulfatase activity
MPSHTANPPQGPYPLTERHATLAALLALAIAVPARSNAATPPPVVENGLGMPFVLIPAGEFLMGSDESPEDLAKAYPQYDAERFLTLSDEAPVHRVRITRPFYLGCHEVTVGQFRRFIEASGYVPESIADGTGGYGYNPACDPATSPRGDAFEGRDPRFRPAWRAERSRSAPGRRRARACGRSGEGAARSRSRGGRMQAPPRRRQAMSRRGHGEARQRAAGRAPC